MSSTIRIKESHEGRGVSKADAYETMQGYNNKKSLSQHLLDSRSSDVFSSHEGAYLRVGIENLIYIENDYLAVKNIFFTLASFRSEPFEIKYEDRFEEFLLYVYPDSLVDGSRVSGYISVHVEEEGVLRHIEPLNEDVSNHVRVREISFYRKNYENTPKLIR